MTPAYHKMEGWGGWHLPIRLGWVAPEGRLGWVAPAYHKKEGWGGWHLPIIGRKVGVGGTCLS